MPQGTKTLPGSELFAAVPVCTCFYLVGAPRCRAHLYRVQFAKKQPKPLPGTGAQEHSPNRAGSSARPHYSHAANGLRGVVGERAPVTQAAPCPHPHPFSAFPPFPAPYGDSLPASLILSLSPSHSLVVSLALPFFPKVSSRGTSSPFEKPTAPILSSTRPLG
ncbi:hypothetical protein VUR80DRAFT_4716 [Thermomyces stellatus]